MRDTPSCFSVPIRRGADGSADFAGNVELVQLSPEDAPGCPGADVESNATTATPSWLPAHWPHIHHAPLGSARVRACARHPHVHDCASRASHSRALARAHWTSESHGRNNSIVPERLSPGVMTGFKIQLFQVRGRGQLRVYPCVLTTKQPADTNPCHFFSKLFLYESKASNSPSLIRATGDSGG